MQQKAKIIFMFLSLIVLLQSCALEHEDDECELTVTIMQQGNSTLVAEPSLGESPFTYEWSNGVHLSEITVTSSGTYWVTVTDFKGCTATTSFEYTYTPACSPAIVADADGNTYDVVTIGSQCWMQQNLKVSSGMPQVSDSVAWAALTTPAWCYYANNSANAGYGKLYNWPAVKAGNLCPKGWHIATLDEWNELITYLGGQNIAGGKMKTTTGWQSPNTGTTNSSGFTAYGSGYRGTNGRFWDEMKVAAFWTGTPYATDTTQAWAVTLNYQYTLAAAGWSPKKSGYSCRCVKD